MEERRDNISYDEGWQSVSVPEPALTVTPEEEPEAHSSRRRRFPKQPVLTLRLAVCLLLGFAAFGWRSVGGAAYERAKAEYSAALNDTAIFDKARGFDMKSLSGATADEI